MLWWRSRNGGATIRPLVDLKEGFQRSEVFWRPAAIFGGRSRVDDIKYLVNVVCQISVRNVEESLPCSWYIFYATFVIS